MKLIILKLLVSYTLSCTLTNPIAMEDCFIDSTIDKNCCFLKEINGVKTMCYQFDPRSSSMVNRIKISDTEYIAYCDLNTYTPSRDY